jgi:biotin carboxyl carrier protein
MRYIAQIGEQEFTLEVVRRGSGRYDVRVNGRARLVETGGNGAAAALSVDGRPFDASISVEKGAAERSVGRAYGVTLGGHLYPVRILDPLRRRAASGNLKRHGNVDVRSTMPGRVTAVLVKEGETIRAGQGLVVVEAMKMENEIPAPKDGRVSGIRVKAGDSVEAGALLVNVE